MASQQAMKSRLAIVRARNDDQKAADCPIRKKWADPTLTHTISVVKSVINPYIHITTSDEVLVAGCGDGTEACLIAQLFKTKTIGVDLSISEHSDVSDDNVELHCEDLTHLPYSSSRFAFIYCYHVLEHVSNRQAVLSELARVLRADGVLFIGFPNKNRLIGYIGTYDDVSFGAKVRWNISDWTAKARGRFENNAGAHAGFTQAEFIRDAARLFAKIIPARNEYMKAKYAGQAALINMLIRCRMEERVFPSNYFICTH